MKWDVFDLLQNSTFGIHYSTLDNGSFNKKEYEQETFLFQNFIMLV